MFWKRLGGRWSTFAYFGITILKPSYEKWCWPIFLQFGSLLGSKSSSSRRGRRTIDHLRDKMGWSMKTSKMLSDLGEVVDRFNNFAVIDILNFPLLDLEIHLNFLVSRWSPEVTLSFCLHLFCLDTKVHPRPSSLVETKSVSDFVFINRPQSYFQMAIWYKLDWIWFCTVEVKVTVQEC